MKLPQSANPLHNEIIYLEFSISSAIIQLNELKDSLLDKELITKIEAIIGTLTKENL